MKRKPFFLGIGSALAMLALILDGKTALLGARQGIELCLQTVVPSLFPFFFLTNLLTSTLSGCPSRVLRPLGKLFGVPAGTESLVLTGLLGGYPAGAQGVAQCVQAGQLSQEEANRLLAFCNQPGPAFLFGMASFLFPAKWMIWLLWAILLLSALLTAQFFSEPRSKSGFSVAAERKVPSSALTSALRAIGIVCGWVVLFRVLLAFLSRWILWLLPREMQVLLTGLLELTNGCLLWDRIAGLRLRFAIAAGIMSFGGLCVTMQTLSLLRGLSAKYYLLGKLVQTCIALSLAVAAVWGIWLPMVVVFLIFALVRQKRGSIPGPVGV